MKLETWKENRSDVLKMMDEKFLEVMKNTNYYIKEAQKLVTHKKINAHLDV